MKKLPFRLSLVYFLFVVVLGVRAQDSAKYSLQLLAPEMIMTPNLDIDGFGDWFQGAKEALDPIFAGADQPKRGVGVLVTFHAQGAVTIGVTAKPKLDEGQRQAILKGLQSVKPYNTKHYDFSMLLWVEVNGGEVLSLEGMEPELEFPQEQKHAAYQAMDLKGKVLAFQQFAREELIPVAAYHEGIVDPKFAGVKAVGQLLEKGKYLGGKVEAMTSENFDYWRATVEMQQGIQLIPFTKMAMLIAEGQFGWAERYFLLIKLFSDKSSLPALYREELEFLFDGFGTELQQQVNAGIALHDDGKYAEAIAHYQSLLQVCPKSAWVKYELYFSKDAQSVKAGAEPGEGWAAAKQGVYACDPLYPMDAKASSGREGYLLSKRMQLGELFKKQGQLKQDLVAYADIAMTLGEYGYAAQLYWLFNLHFSKSDYQNRNIIAYFLYCLDKLGVDGMEENFEGNFEKEFKKIDDQRQKEMESNAMYKSFESK
jgi:hypothetical protein